MVERPSHVYRNTAYPVIGWTLVAGGVVMGVLWLLLAEDRAAQVVCPAFAWAAAAFGFVGYARPGWSRAATG